MYDLFIKYVKSGNTSVEVTVTATAAAAATAAATKFHE